MDPGPDSSDFEQLTTGDSSLLSFAVSQLSDIHAELRVKAKKLEKEKSHIDRKQEILKLLMAEVNLQMESELSRRLNDHVKDFQCRLLQKDQLIKSLNTDIHRYQSTLAATRTTNERLQKEIDELKEKLSKSVTECAKLRGRIRVMKSAPLKQKSVVVDNLDDGPPTDRNKQVATMSTQTTASEYHNFSGRTLVSGSSEEVSRLLNCLSRCVLRPASSLHAELALNPKKSVMKEVATTTHDFPNIDADPSLLLSWALPLSVRYCSLILDTLSTPSCRRLLASHSPPSPAALMSVLCHHMEFIYWTWFLAKLQQHDVREGQTLSVSTFVDRLLQRLHPNSSSVGGTSRDSGEIPFCVELHLTAYSLGLLLVTRVDVRQACANHIHHCLSSTHTSETESRRYLSVLHFPLLCCWLLRLGAGALFDGVLISALVDFLQPAFCQEDDKEEVQLTESAGSSTSIQSNTNKDIMLLHHVQNIVLTFKHGALMTLFQFMADPHATETHREKCAQLLLFILRRKKSMLRSLQHHSPWNIQSMVLSLQTALTCCSTNTFLTITIQNMLGILQT